MVNFMSCIQFIFYSQFYGLVIKRYSERLTQSEIPSLKDRQKSADLVQTSKITHALFSESCEAFVTLTKNQLLQNLYPF